MIISVLEAIGPDPVLAGASDGRRLFAALISKVSTVSEPTLLFINFGGVSVATGSYLRESVVAFRDYVRDNLPYFYPIIANAAPAVMEELEHLMQLRGDTMITCRVGHDERPSDISLVGHLDKTHSAIIDAIRKLGEIDARRIAELFASEKIGITAWNNRLASLATKGLLIETRHGRSKSYRLALNGV